MHLHETAEEIATSLKRYGIRPLERLDELGLVTPLLVAVHMTQLLPGEIERLAVQGASVVHCPESNLKLGSGICPAFALREAGVNLALGTDGAASNNDLDMFGEMKTAALIATGFSQCSDRLPAAAVLQMATLNGARALGLQDRVGSLLPGKEADLICVDLSRAATQPVYAPISQLVYACSRDQVTDVWVAGQHLLEQAQPTLADAQAILARARAWGEKIRGARGSRTQ